MAVNLSFIGGAGWQFFDNNGNVLSGGLLYTYAAGTTTPQTTYTSRSGTIANTNPIILDSAGRTPEQIWSTEGLLYKYVVADSDNIIIRTWDNIGGSLVPSDLAQDLANSSNPAKGDALVGFRQSNSSGNLPNSVGRTVHQKLQEIISPLDFGAVGDGITDDTVALTNALNSSSNTVIDGASKTYKITAPISVTTENIVVQNMTIDMSAVPAQPGNDFILKFEGTQSTAVNLTANLNANTNVVTVGTTSSFAVDQYVFIQSIERFWAAIEVGQYAKVKSIDSETQLTLYDNVLYDFATANVSTISPVNTKNNVNIVNVKIIGAQANLQAAIYLSLCADVYINNCSFINVDYCCIYVSRCVNVVVNATDCRYSRATSGLSYGVVFLNGTYNGIVSNGYSEDQRHYVATGSATSEGGVNLYITVANNHITSARNAGIDAHPPTDYYTVTGNTIEQASGLTGTLDGIICQGLNCVITNNTVVNASRHAIFHQILPNISSGSTIIANNLIRGGGASSATDTGINVTNDTTGAATLNGVCVTGNVIEGQNDFHILITAVTGSISNVAVTGNVTRQNSTSSSLRLRAQGTGTTVDDITITGNIFKTSGTQNLYLLGSATSSLNRVSITGNNINGGTNGIRYDYVNFSTQVNNQISNFVTRVLIANSTNLVLDTRQEGIVYLTGSPTYTVGVTDIDIVANRATTITLTLPDPTQFTGRILNIKTIQAQSVISASANVQPIDDITLGTAILPATDGAWATLKCNGTSWVIMQRGT